MRQEILLLEGIDNILNHLSKPNVPLQTAVVRLLTIVCETRLPSILSLCFFVSFFIVSLKKHDIVNICNDCSANTREIES